MDIASVIGVVIGVGLLAGIILIDGEPQTFIDLRSISVPLGGTFAALLINYSIKQMVEVKDIVKVAFTRNGINIQRVLRQLIEYAEIARKEGLLVLDDKLSDIKDPFMNKGLGMVVDGTEIETIKKILYIELDSMVARHEKGREVFETAGALAPAFGMIGTLIGLIQMLRDLEDPSGIASGMAIALLTTLYGALLANLVFIPIAGKLQVRTVEEVKEKELAIEGLLAIRKGENPKFLEEKLLTFLSPEERRKWNLNEGEVYEELLEESAIV